MYTFFEAPIGNRIYKIPLKVDLLAYDKQDCTIHVAIPDQKFVVGEEVAILESPIFIDNEDWESK